MWPEWTITVCQTLCYMAEWKGRESKETKKRWLDNVTDNCYHRTAVTACPGIATCDKKKKGNTNINYSIHKPEP